MNTRVIFAIAKKDLYEASRNKSVWLPIMIVPIIFILILPLVIMIIASLPETAQSAGNMSDIEDLMKIAPDFIRNVIAGLNSSQTMIVMVLGYFFAPMFLILPIMFSTVIASESFAGERERKTIEAILYTPVSKAELFIGKVLASFIPAVMITWASFIGYIIVMNVGGYGMMGRVWFPLTSWYPLIFWVSPALSLLGIAVTVLISSKVQTFMGAYQTSASLVVLVLGLIVGQATGLLYLNVWAGLLLGLVIWIADAILVKIAIRSFNREKLLISAG